MPYQLQEITAAQLDAFYDAFGGEKSYLQTSAYGDFRAKLGEKNLRYGIFESQSSNSKELELIGIAQIQKITARRGTFLHVPHGPLITEKKEERQKEENAWSFFLSQYPTIGREQQCDFVRCSPLLSSFPLSSLAKAWRPAPIHLMNPERTWVLDLTQSEDDILANMRKSTRYEVRRIAKVGIEVQMGNSTADLDIFWELHLETVRRQGFVPFARHTTEAELETFGDGIQIFSSKIDQKYYSSSIIVFDKHAAYYHQGASLPHKLPVAHATLWAAICEAKRRGCREFNFWGVSPEDQKSHPWYGLSRFKRGFGGEERVFLHCQDYPLTTKYWLNWTVEKYRKWKRNY